jgi:hypothetical protein
MGRRLALGVSMSGSPDQPPPTTRSWRSADLRPIAIGAAAGLLVLLVGGLALAASQLGGPTDVATGPQPGHVGAGPGSDRGHVPAPDRLRDRTQDRRAQGPAFRLPLRGQLGPGITISAISGSDITLTSPSGWTRMVTVTDATTLTRAGQKIAVTDLKVGDEVRVQETRNADGTTTISQIDVVLPEVVGRVTATSPDTITIARADGTSMTVHVEASTTYQVRGLTTATLADIKAGMVVVATGSQNADGSLQALAVRAATAG